MIIGGKPAFLEYQRGGNGRGPAHFPASGLFHIRVFGLLRWCGQLLLVVPPLDGQLRDGAMGFYDGGRKLGQQTTVDTRAFSVRLFSAFGGDK